MSKKHRNPNADLNLPDSTSDRLGQGPMRFDDAYIEQVKNEHNAALKSPSVEPDTCCEYSLSRLDLGLLRDCTLSKVQCGEDGWHYHYEQCDLRKHALHGKQKQEEKNGDSGSTS